MTTRSPARIRNLYFAVNVLRLARSGTCGSGRGIGSSFTRSGSAIPNPPSSTPNVNVISGISSPPTGVNDCQEVGASSHVDRQGCHGPGGEPRRTWTNETGTETESRSFRNMHDHSDANAETGAPRTCGSQRSRRRPRLEPRLDVDGW